MEIEEANRAVEDFLKKSLKRDGRLIKNSKTNEGWEAEVEVIEENAFIKSLGIPAKVQDRNIYEIKLNDNLEVVSYARMGREVHKV